MTINTKLNGLATNRPNFPLEWKWQLMAKLSLQKSMVQK